MITVSKPAHESVGFLHAKGGKSSWAREFFNEEQRKSRSPSAARGFKGKGLWKREPTAEELRLNELSKKVWPRDSFTSPGQTKTKKDGTLTCTSMGQNVPRLCSLKPRAH